MIQRRKVQRAFTGLVGLPPEPDEKPVVSRPVAAQEPVASVTPLSPQKSKSALRSERLRERKRKELGDEAFREQERKRKEMERAEQDRQAQIAAVVAEPDKPLTVVNAEGETVRVISGGFGSRRVADVDDKSEQIENTDGRRVTPSGSGHDAEKDAWEHASKFVHKAFQRVKTSREVKAMNAFIYSNVQRYNHKSELTICSHCKAHITPFPSYVPSLAFHHFHDVHPKLFETMMMKVQKASEKLVCPIDHDAVKSRFAAQSARDGQKLQCGHCHRILWRPGDYLRKRSDKQKLELATTNAA